MKGASIIDLERLRKEGHENCFACTHPELKLDFETEGAHSLRASIKFTESMTSFNGMVHGGITAFIMDQAMACALMAEGVYGATADMQLRYLNPVKPGIVAHVQATVESRFHQMYRMKAELFQNDRVCARVKARFMRQALSK